MRRILSLLLTLCLIIGAVPMFASAAETSGTIGDLTWTLSEDRVLTISGNGAMPDYTDYYESPLSKLGFMPGKGAPAKAIVIEPGVTHIGDYAFSMTMAMSITIPDTVTSIGNYAFYCSGCGQNGPNEDPMEMFEIPRTVETIGDSAFASFGAKAIVVPPIRLGKECFKGSMIEKFYMPDSREVQPNDVLSETFRLTDIYFGGDEDVYGMLGLNEMGYDTANVTVHYNAEIPGEPDAPSGPDFPLTGSCGAQGDNVKWKLEEDGTLTISGTGAMADYEIPKGWFDYEDPNGEWFLTTSFIQKIIIENGVTHIGSYAFQQCYGPTEIRFPESMASIGMGAFAGSSGIKRIYLPAGIKSIEEGAFAKCEYINDIYYDGTKEQWAQVKIGRNGFDSNYTVHYKDAPSTGFSDVKSDAYYADAVTWAVENNVTKGTGGNKFSPDGPCTRAQIVTMLYRAKGSPAVTVTNKFSDMPADPEVQKAISWAVQENVTQGVGGGKFGPGQTCTRVQAVTFLWRAAGSPEPVSTATFSDMPSYSDFRKAISWAAENNITTGAGGNKFDPEGTCSRGQIVTFLYRARGSVI